MIPSYTLVCGVDRNHLDQLARVWPTWREHKPALTRCPMIVFVDDNIDREVRSIVDNPNLEIVHWPPDDVEYEGIETTENMTDLEKYQAMWNSSQRYKMLAGFCYISTYRVDTDYWLKLDLSVHATGQSNWIDSDWFYDEPAIVSHRWGYTKPADQMLIMDKWIEGNKHKMDLVFPTLPLGLVPEKGSSRVVHKRIISWCAFFNTQFTRQVMLATEKICGLGKLPIKSQDGFLWYMAKRMGLPIIRTNMKKRGWEHKPTRPFSMNVLRD